MRTAGGADVVHPFEERVRALLASEPQIIWEAGGAAQCDLWFPPRKIPLEDGTARLLHPVSPCSVGMEGKGIGPRSRWRKHCDQGVDHPRSHRTQPTEVVVGSVVEVVSVPLIDLPAGGDPM